MLIKENKETLRLLEKQEENINNLIELNSLLANKLGFPLMNIKDLKGYKVLLKKVKYKNRHKLNKKISDRELETYTVFKKKFKIIAYQAFSNELTGNVLPILEGGYVIIDLDNLSVIRDKRIKQIIEIKNANKLKIKELLQIDFINLMKNFEVVDIYFKYDTVTNEEYKEMKKLLVENKIEELSARLQEDFFRFYISGIKLKTKDFIIEVGKNFKFKVCSRDYKKHSIFKVSKEIEKIIKICKK